MFEDIFEKTLYTFIVLFLSLAFVAGIGMTISLYKRDILNQDEKIKLLEQSLQEQIEEKQVYINILKEKGEN